MITRQDLDQLQSLVKVPALSILLPTHRTSPDNKQDPIRVKNYSQGERLPLIVGGVDRQISFFREVSQVAQLVAGTLSGNFDKTPLHELTTPVWEIVQSVRKAQQEDALQMLDKAMSSQSVVSTIGEVWRLAHEGRGKLLLVEKNYHVPAILDEQGKFQQVEQAGGVEVMDDAVDEVIETVLAKGGDVAIVDDGTLSQHQQIALTLRY